MDACGGLIGEHQLDPTHFLFSFSGARRKYQLQCPNLLMRGGDCAAGDFSLGASCVHAFALHQNLDLAPIEQSLEIGEQGHRQRHARHRSLSSIDLMQDYLHARLSGVEHARLLHDEALMFGEHLLGVVEDPLALAERDFER